MARRSEPEEMGLGFTFWSPALWSGCFTSSWPQPLCPRSALDQLLSPSFAILPNSPKNRKYP